jgi:hypothetical protein
LSTCFLIVFWLLNFRFLLFFRWHYVQLYFISYLIYDKIWQNINS